MLDCILCCCRKNERTSTKIGYIVNDLKELTEEEFHSVLEHIRQAKERAALNLSKVKLKLY
jgi:hypothetical protein